MSIYTYLQNSLLLLSSLNPIWTKNKKKNYNQYIYRFLCYCKLHREVCDRGVHRKALWVHLIYYTNLGQLMVLHFYNRLGSARLKIKQILGYLDNIQQNTKYNDRTTYMSIYTYLQNSLLLLSSLNLIWTKK